MIDFFYICVNGTQKAVSLHYNERSNNYSIVIDISADGVTSMTHHIYKTKSKAEYAYRLFKKAIELSKD